jgi:hypothetical protein
MLVMYSILLILLLQTDLLIGHGLMAENDRAIRSGSYAIIPCALAHDRADRSYNNLLSKHSFFPRMLRTLKYFKLPNLSASRSRFRIPRAVETERYHFSRETNRHAIICCTYKTGHYCVRQVSSLSPLPIRFLFCYFLLLCAPWLTPLSPILLLPALRRSMTTNLGITQRRRVPRW